jgi:hypothetical protein
MIERTVKMQKKFIGCKFIICFLTVIFMNQITEAAWEQAGNPATGDVTGLVACNGNLFLGTRTKGVLISKNNGTSWTSASYTLPIDTSVNLYFPVTSLASNKSELFAHVDTGGYLRRYLYSSSNNGNSWTRIGIGQGYMWNYGLCDSALYIAKCLVQISCPIQLSQSCDNGLSWQALNTIPTGIDPRFSYFPMPIAMIGGNIFAGFSPAGVFLSVDNGMTWQPANYGLSDLTVYSMIAFGSKLFVATSDNSAFISENSGASWKKADSGLAPYTSYTTPTNRGRQFAAMGENVFACSDSGVYLAERIGSRWVWKNMNFVAQVFDLAISNGYLFALTFSDGVWRRLLSEMPLATLQKYSEKSNGFSYDIRNSNVLTFTIPQEAFVSLTIYDLRGKLVLAAVNKAQPAGSYSVALEKAVGLSSGNYLMIIKAGKFMVHRRIAIVR